MERTKRPSRDRPYSQTDHHRCGSRQRWMSALTARPVSEQVAEEEHTPHVSPHPSLPQGFRLLSTQVG